MSKHNPKASKETKGIDSFFSKKHDVISHVKDDILKELDSKIVDVKPIKEEKITKSIVDEFYESLTSNEKITHNLAKTMLGTSYDVMRTHGFLTWLKTKKS